MRATAAVAALTAAITLGGCGGNPQADVRAKVHEFADAVAAHDYSTICSDVLAPSLLADFARGGISCRQALRIALGGVRHPHLALGPVKVTGAHASALTISQAAGQKTVLTSLVLTDTAKGWRISSLGSAAG